MKKLALFLLSASLLACQTEKKTGNGSDTTALSSSSEISFVYDSVKVVSNHIVKNENTTDTTKAVLTYPVSIDTALNKFIEQKLMTFANEGEHFKTYQEFVDAFIKNYDNFIKENKDYSQTWFMDGKIDVVEKLPHYFSALITYVTYEGGAHPNSVFTYLNYDPINHKEIVLNDLINPDSMSKLTAVAEKIFRKNEKLSPTESLKDKYFFENDTFSLNQNFTITEKGLKFLYNPYEIKAYVYGTTELLIPFAELKDIAKPNSLLNPAK
jgi:hypothetical protein